MSQKVEHVMDQLIIHRKIVLMVLAGILALSLLVGFAYQNKLTKKQEASRLFDNAWQGVSVVVNDLQRQPNATYSADNPNLPQVKQLYQQAINDIDTLIFEYGNTVAGVRGALLGTMVLNLTNLNNLLEDPTIVENFKDSASLTKIKKKFPKFWGAALALSEGVRYEQTFQYDQALKSYEEALTLDKEKFMSDYTLISIARVNEVLNNNPVAIENYQRVANEYPQSVWLSFAMGKVYLLSQEKPAN